MPQNAKTHQSLERALELLLHFRQQNKEYSAQELSDHFGLHKSTGRRLLAVLKKHGFLRRNPENKKYSLGPSIAALGTSLLKSMDYDLTHVARPYLEDLREAAGETTVLELPNSTHSVMAVVCEGLGPVRIKGVVGDHHHYHTSAGAKALIAFADPEQREAVLAEGLEAVTPNSQTDRDEFEKEMAEIRRRGFSFDGQENNLGVQAFGAPVFNHEGRPAAAVVIAGAAQNVTWEKRDHFVTLLKETARKLSQELYFSKPAASDRVGPQKRRAGAADS